MIFFCVMTAFHLDQVDTDDSGLTKPIAEST